MNNKKDVEIVISCSSGYNKIKKNCFITDVLLDRPSLLM